MCWKFTLGLFIGVYFAFSAFAVAFGIWALVVAHGLLRLSQFVVGHSTTLLLWTQSTSASSGSLALSSRTQLSLLWSSTRSIQRGPWLFIPLDMMCTCAHLRIAQSWTWLHRRLCQGRPLRKGVGACGLAQQWFCTWSWTSLALQWLGCIVLVFTGACFIMVALKLWLCFVALVWSGSGSSSLLWDGLAVIHI